MIKYFYLEDYPYKEGWFIKLDSSKIDNFKYKGGSLAIIQSRVMNMSFPQYCRMCRDCFGAELRGKQGYPSILFLKKDIAMVLCELLNKQFNIIMKERQSAFK